MEKEKDPAFLFYSEKFIAGVQTLNFEDRGKLITLLALMHQQGRMSEETIRFIVGSISLNLQSKFQIDENGLWYNVKLEKEIEKRAKFAESRRSNGRKGGRKPLGYPNAYPNGYPTNKPTENHTINTNIDIDINKDKEENKSQKREKSEPKYVNNPFGVEGWPLWDRWKEYRKAEFRKTYKTAETEQQALNKLHELSGGRLDIAEKIVTTSIANQWQGLFTLKTDKNEKSFTNHRGIEDFSKPGFNRSPF